MHPMVAAALILSGSLLILAPYVHHAWMVSRLSNLYVEGVKVDLRTDALTQMFTWYNDACLFAGIVMICIAVVGALYHNRLRRDAERLARMIDATAQNTHQ